MNVDNLHPSIFCNISNFYRHNLHKKFQFTAKCGLILWLNLSHVVSTNFVVNGTVCFIVVKWLDAWITFQHSMVSSMLAII